MFEKKAVNLDLNTALGKSTAVSTLLPVLAAINDPIRQAHYLQRLAALVKVDMNTIQSSLNQLKQSARKRNAGPLKPVIKPHHLRASHAREEYLLTMLLQNPQYKQMQEDISIYIENSVNREIYRSWQEAEDLSALKERLDPAVHEYMDAILDKKLPPSLRNDIEQRIMDCIGELKRTYLKSMAARRAESAATDAGPLRPEEDLEISQRLLNLDIDRARKRKSSFGRTRS